MWQYRTSAMEVLLQGFLLPVSLQGSYLSATIVSQNKPCVQIGALINKVTTVTYKMPLYNKQQQFKKAFIVISKQEAMLYFWNGAKR